MKAKTRRRKMMSTQDGRAFLIENGYARRPKQKTKIHRSVCSFGDPT